MKDIIMPMQPIVDHRFVENRIVSMLLDKCQENGFGLNEIAVMAAQNLFTKQEQMQLAQLIGYSLSGFAELNYVDDETYGAAEYRDTDSTSELESRNAELRDQLETARKGLRQAAGALFKIHPDDLQA